MADPRSDAPAAERAGDFERYALVAMMTLVILCLLFVDGLRHREAGAPPPRAERRLRIEIGGTSPAAEAPTLVAPARERSPTAHAARTVDPEPVKAQMPTPTVAPEREPAPVRRTYVVRDGDTLSTIASSELGSVTRMAEIARLNALADPDVLSVGQTLVLPAR
jgi:nucleoid-associated protein YgaU